MSFDYELFVIGGGSGGVRAARTAAGFGARVGLAESAELGGTCVNLGCVPKKMLAYGAAYADEFAQAPSYGWTLDQAAFDWPTLLANKNREIARLNGIYADLLDRAAVRTFRGHARLLDAHTIDIQGQVVRAENILIATGGEPQLPAVPGIEHAITSDQAFHLPALPRRIVVVGGGYIAVEFASIFHGMGAQVTQLYRGTLFLGAFDDGVGLFGQLAQADQGKGIAGNEVRIGAGIVRWPEAGMDHAGIFGRPAITARQGFGRLRCCEVETVRDVIVFAMLFAEGLEPHAHEGLGHLRKLRKLTEPNRAPALV